MLLHLSVSLSVLRSPPPLNYRPCQPHTGAWSPCLPHARAALVQPPWEQEGLGAACCPGETHGPPDPWMDWSPGLFYGGVQCNESGSSQLLPVLDLPLRSHCLQPLPASWRREIGRLHALRAQPSVRVLRPCLSFACPWGAPFSPLRLHHAPALSPRGDSAGAGWHVLSWETLSGGRGR